MKLFTVLTAASVLALASSAALAQTPTVATPKSPISISAFGSLGIAKINGSGANIGTWTNNNAGAGAVADVIPVPGATVSNNSTTSTGSYSAYVPVGTSGGNPKCTGSSCTSTGTSTGGSSGTVGQGGTSLNVNGNYLIGEVNGGTATASNTVSYTLPASTGGTVTTPETGTTSTAPVAVGDIVSKTEVTSSSGIGTGSGTTKVSEFGAVASGNLSVGGGSPLPASGTTGSN